MRTCAMLVIDEISMFGALEMARLSRALRLLQPHPTDAEAPFGAVHVVFVGDFAQLPPVCALALTSCAAGVVAPSRAIKPEQMRGLELWNTAINAVVELTLPMRAAGDLPFAASRRASRRTEDRQRRAWAA